MKKKILIAVLALLTIALCFTSCGGSKAVSGIVITDGTMSYEYQVGQAPDFSEVTAQIKYNDGTFKTVGASELSFSSLDTSSPGRQTLSITYEGYTLNVQVTIVGEHIEENVVTLQSIEILSSSIDLSVFIGDSFDPQTVKVNATYSDGTSKILDNADLTIGSIDTSSVGLKTLMVSYEGLTATANVRVVGVESMVVVSGSVKNEVKVGDTYSALGIQVSVTYTDGTTATVGADKLTLGTVDTSKVGNVYLSITHLDKTYQYKVLVNGTVSIKVDPMSVASSIRYGEALNTSDLSAVAVDAKGKETPIAISELTIGSIDSTKVGTQALTVKYGAFETSVNVTVVGVESITVISDSVKTEILVGDTLNTSALQATVKFTDGTSELLSANALTLGSISSAEAGTKKLSVQYLNGSAEVDIKVCGIQGIRIEGVPKAIAATDEAVDPTKDMKVYAVYSDSAKTEKLITSGYTTNASELDFKLEGDKTLKVTYGTFSAEAVISTSAPALESIELRTYDASVKLYHAYDSSKITVTATFANGTTEVISAGDLTISAIDTSKAGTVKLTVSYTDPDTNGTKETSADVKVLAVTALSISGVPALVDIGSPLYLSLMVIMATYEDASTEKIDVSLVNITNIDTAKAGDQKLTAEYAGVSASADVHVKALDKIEIVPSSIASSVKLDGVLDTSKLQIKLIYTDGSSESLTAGADGLTVGTIDTSSKGDKTLTVSYSGKTATATVKVIGIKSIAIDSSTISSVVDKGANLTTSGLKVTVTYEDDTTASVGASDPALIINSFSTAEAGDKIFSVSYKGFTAEKTIHVKGVKSISLVDGSIKTEVPVGSASFDTTGIQVNVIYTNGEEEKNLTVADGVQVGTIDLSTEGVKQLPVTYNGETVYINITVKKVTGVIYGVSLPAHITERETLKNSFKDSSLPYYVGDDNPFVLSLVLMMLDDNDELVGAALSYTSVSTVYLVDGNNETIVGSEYVTIDESKNSFDFTEAAIGKTFKIVTRPATGFIAGQEANVTRSHVVTIVDAYNIDDPKELNVITNVEDDVNGSVGGYISRQEVVNSFLQNNGITRPSSINGAVIHGNLDIKRTDIPSEYIYQYEKDGVQKEGLYDWMYVFDHENTAANTNFKFYGNYYTIYSYNLPTVVEKNIANNPDEYSSSSLFRFTVADSCKGPAFDHTKYSTDIIGLALRDNDPNSNVQEDSERHMRGLSALKTLYQIVNVENTKIEAFMISMVPEDDYLTVNINNCDFYNAWQGHLFIWNNNDGFQDVNTAPYENHQNIVINITNSRLAKCGGPVILSQNNNAEYACNSKSGADIYVDANSELYSYVTGSEAWFVAVGQSATAGQLFAMDALISGTASAMGKTAAFTSTSNPGMEGVATVNLLYVNMGTGTTGTAGESYGGSFNVAGSTAFSSSNNPMLDAYISATGGQAPIFQSSAGGTCFTDTTALYGIETGAPGAPTTNCFDGDFITINFGGLNITLQYYH